MGEGEKWRKGEGRRGECKNGRGVNGEWEKGMDGTPFYKTVITLTINLMLFLNLIFSVKQKEFTAYKQQFLNDA